MTTEAIEVSQREAVAELAAYFEAHEQEKLAKAAKAMLSKKIKKYLTDHEGEVLWDGEHEIEASLQPWSAPRWLDPKVPTELLRWALEMGIVKLAVTELDKFAKQNPDAAAVKDIRQFTNPGGTGTPRLHVGPKEDGQG